VGREGRGIRGGGKRDKGGGRWQVLKVTGSCAFIKWQRLSGERGGRGIGYNESEAFIFYGDLAYASHLFILSIGLHV
jgi:hypothetical protein